MAITRAEARYCVIESDIIRISQRMESRNGDQDYLPYTGAPQWHPYTVPRSLQAPTQYGQDRLSEPRFTPGFHTVLSGHPNFQHPFQGPSRTMTGVVTERPQLPASYQETYVDGAHGLEPAVILDRSTFSTCPPAGPLPFRNMIQDSRIEGPFDRSSEPWMWPQGDPHGQQAYSFGSDSFGNNDNGSSWQPDDPYTPPPRPQWTDPPFPRTPSPGSGNHDSPGLPGTPYRERMRDYAAEEGPLELGILNWSLNVPFPRRIGHTRATQEAEPTTQRYYPDGQSFLLNISGSRPFSWSWKKERLKTSPPSAGRIEALLTRSVLCSYREWYRYSPLPSSPSS